MNVVENKIKIDVNKICELSQDSYYTRNPQDSKVKGLIGPDSPASIFVKSIELQKFEDKTDGDVWYSAKVEHDSIWEIYTDTAVGPFVEKQLVDAGIVTNEFKHCDFSEQGMQDNGVADLDVVFA